jgi:3-deoxy-D-manno-octulosonic-acid transferase
MGRSSENFREIVDAMKAANAIRITETHEIAGAFVELLRDEESARAMGERERQVFRAQAGATSRTVASLLDLLNRKAS